MLDFMLVLCKEECVSETLENTASVYELEPSSVEATEEDLYQNSEQNHQYHTSGMCMSVNMCVFDTHYTSRRAVTCVLVVQMIMEKILA